MKINNFSLIIGFLFASIIIISCDKSKKYDIPTTYNFINASYSGQIQRLDMLEELEVYMKTSNTSGTAIDAATMKAMFANDGHTWNATDLNSSTKQLKSKTFELDHAAFESYMDSLAVASTSTTVGSYGVAGVVASNDGLKSYLFNANGVEYTQLIAKGIMGACFYYQATSVYTGNDKMDVDNSTNIDGEDYTKMEHHWDEAFGYFGAPIDFTRSTTAGYRFWAKYAFKGDAAHDLINKIMTAFIKGRAAISNQDIETRDAQITELRTSWELISVTTAIYYLEAAKGNIADDALRNHELSEALAFIRALAYNVDARISATEIAAVEAYLGTSFYTVTVSDIDMAINQLKTIYGIS